MSEPYWVPLGAALDPANYQPKSEKGAVSGYAGLGADGKVPTAQLGLELAYTERTSPVTIPVVAEAAAVDVLVLPATNYGGAIIVLEFYAPFMTVGTGVNSFTILSLYDDSGNLGRMNEFSNPTANSWSIGPVVAKRRLTTSGVTQTYRVKGFAIGQPGTTGAQAWTMPAFFRATRV